MKINLLHYLLIVIFGSMAINLSAQSFGDYRSKISGNWSTPGNWEKYVLLSGWVTASSPPTSSDGVISILAGHNITISGLVTADQVVVNSGGILTVNNNFSLNDGVGDDLVINGTCVWNNFAITGPGNVIVGASGIFNLTTNTIKTIAAPITINGLMNWQNGDILINSTTLINNGTITISGNNNISGNGTLQNNGTITKTSTGLTKFILGGVSNAGTLNIIAGTLQIK